MWFVRLARRRSFAGLRLRGLTLLALLLLCNSNFAGVRDIQYDRQASLVALAYERTGQLDLALAYYREAAAHTSYFIVHLDHARLALRMGLPQEAEAAFRRAIESGPPLAEGYAGLGDALAAQGRVAEAIEAHRRALEIDPQFSDSQERLAEYTRDPGGVGEEP
jgi:tetratricopeptide (TPR) repeat protein